MRQRPLPASRGKAMTRKVLAGQSRTPAHRRPGRDLHTPVRTVDLLRPEEYETEVQSNQVCEGTDEPLMQPDLTMPLRPPPPPLWDGPSRGPAATDRLEVEWSVSALQRRLEAIEDSGLRRAPLGFAEGLAIGATASLAVCGFLMGAAALVVV